MTKRLAATPGALDEDLDLEGEIDETEDREPNISHDEDDADDLWDAGARSADAADADERVLEERKRAAEARKKVALRRAHFAALGPRLPTSLDGKWALFVIEYLLDEMHNDSRRAAYQSLVEPGPVKGTVNISKELKSFAADQEPGGRVRMIVQLLLANDINVDSYSTSGAKRIAAAAALAKVDLKKVKLPEPATEFPADAKAKAASAAKKPTKKARR